MGQDQAYSQSFNLGLINFTTGVSVLIGRTHRLEHSSAIDTCKFMKLRHQ